MIRQEIVREILSEYDARRRQNRQEQAARIAEACRRDAEIGRLREESARLAFSTMRRIMGGDADAQAAAEAMKRRGQAINAEIRRRLIALGLPEDELEERYACPECRDTGYTGEAPARLCACVEREARRRALLRLEESGFLNQRFEDFDASIIPEEGDQRRQALAIRDICRDYIEQYPGYPYRSIVLYGAGGLGKTFLLNCIYSRAVEKGVAAMRVTAYRLLEAMRRRHLGMDQGEDDFGDMTDAPLLLIDDLGTEPMLRNITVEYLFALLNERITSGRHTVIATNLSPLQLQDRYGERVMSRLVDRSNMVIQMKGKDLRRHEQR